MLFPNQEFPLDRKSAKVSRKTTEKLLSGDGPPEDPAVFEVGMVPGEMNIFMKTESYFLPEGKTWEDLTHEERKELQNKYRFSPYRPGVYQGITGISKNYGGLFTDS